LHIIDTPGNFNVLYGAIDEKGIIKSTDAGDNWFFSSTGITDNSGRFELAIAPSNTNKIYAAAEGNPNSNLWMSTDAGANWIQTYENGSEPDWLSAQGWYDNTIAVHPTFESTVYVGGVRLYQIDVQANNSRNTSQLSTGPVHVDHHNLVIIPGAGGAFRILNANDGGVGISASGASNWDAPINGMVTTQFYGVDKKPGASAYIGGTQDNGTWRSPENSTANSAWLFQIGGDGYETSWHFDDPLKIIGGSQFNGLRRTLDGGLSWESATSGLNNTGSGSAPFITKIAKSNMEPDLLFAVGSSGVWRSTNFGGSWSLSSISGSNWGSVTSFLDVKISRTNPDIVWAGGRMDGSGKINVSTDQGVSFNPTPIYSLTPMGGISGLSTHPIDDSTAYVLFSFAHKSKVLRTTDLGQTWEDLSGFGTDTVSSNGFPDVAVYDLLVMPHTPDTIWIASEIGLIESVDNGVSWQLADNGFPSVAIWAMTHVDDEVVLATHGRGIWSVEIPGLAGGQTFNPLVKNLYQGPDGFLSIDLGLRSSYDSSALFIDGQKYMTFPANSAPVDTLVQYIVTQAGQKTVSVTSYKNGQTYNSISRSINVILMQQAQISYLNDFNTPSNDFSGSGFNVQTVTGFSDDAIHSLHPYTNGLNNTYTLTVPIIVASSNADIVYDDVAIIEPGESGSAFGATNFWDYVVVEGSLDGVNWIPIADGYDAGYDQIWLNAYNSSTSGNSTMFVTHTVDLLNTFSAGDQILLRFRLYSDGYVTAWGWTIDNLKIQENGISSIDEIHETANSFQLMQNYPNPFNPVTNIKFSIPNSEFVTLKIYNTLGQEVATLVSDNLTQGSHKYTWNASDFASGVYYYRIETDGGFVQTRKLILLK